LTMVAPAAPLVVLGWRIAVRAARGRTLAGLALTLAGACAGAAIGLGVSTGRHLALPGVRVAFVMGVTAVGAVAARPLATGVTRLGRRPFALAAFGVILAACGWLADAFVLPRLYPAFHAAMFVAALLGGALLGLSFRASAPRATRTAKLVASL